MKNKIRTIKLKKNETINIITTGAKYQVIFATNGHRQIGSDKLVICSKSYISTPGGGIYPDGEPFGKRGSNE